MDDARYAWWDDFHRTGVDPDPASAPPGASFGLDPDGAPVGFSPNPARASDPTRPERRASPPSSPGDDDNTNTKKIPKILAGWRVRVAPQKLIASAVPSARSTGARASRFARERDRGASERDRGASERDRGAVSVSSQTAPTPVASAPAAAPDGAFTITGLPPFVSNALHTLRGMPVVRLTREVRTPGFRVGVDGRQLCALGELRIVACPDVAVGYNGVLVGEHPEDAVRVSLDVETGVSPEGFFRTTAGIHVTGSVFPRRFPDVFSAGVAVAGVVEHSAESRRDDPSSNNRSRSRGGSTRGSASSSRRSSVLREPGGSLDRESGTTSNRDRPGSRDWPGFANRRRAPPPRSPLAARREDVWWARVRLWRGVYLRVSSECRATSDGRLAFASPTWELAAEADPTQSDPARDHWSFHARGTAAAEARERRRQRRRSRASGLEFDLNDDHDLRDREADEAHVRDRLEREFKSPEEVARRRVEEDRAARREERRARRDEEARERAAFREKARREDAERRARVRERRAERMVLARERVAERREMAARRRREREEAREERAREKEAKEDEREMIREAEEERKAFEREEARRKEGGGEKDGGGKDGGEYDGGKGAAGSKANRRDTSANRRDDVGKDADETKTRTKTRTKKKTRTKTSKEKHAKGTVESVVGSEPAVEPAPGSKRLEAAGSDPGTRRPPADADASNVDEPSSSSTGTPSETVDASSSASSTSASASSTSASASSRASADPRSRLDAARVAAAAAAREEAAAKREADRIAAETAARNERAREETRRRAEQELKDIAAAAEARAKAAAREAKAAKRREAEEARRAALDARDARRREEEEKRAWAKAEAKARARVEAEARHARDAEVAEARRAETARARAERLAAFEEERERKDRAARVAAEERAAARAARAAEEEAASASAVDASAVDASASETSRIRGHRATVALVPGHWIDPGEESGAPGERALNLVIANRAHRLLDARGWTVLRPDLASPPLSWEEYVAWVRAQSRGGVAVLEVHGQGEGASMEGRVTGVIAQRESTLGDALAVRFGVFPMDWTELAVPRLGGAVVESFDATALERLPPEARTAAVDDIAKDIAEAVDSTRRAAEPPVGCSASGCPRA